MKHRKQKKWLGLALAVVLVAAPLAGCAAEPEPADRPPEEVSLRETVTEADPAAALAEIYDTLPDARYDPLTAGIFQEHFADLVGKIPNYYGNISDPNGGLADVIIVQPSTDEDGSREKVREALRLYQETRIREFENYDILDAFTIAQEAEVFDQGDYVVLLMLPDNEEAREIIDRYIPL